MRTSRVCPKCQHTTILLIASVPETQDYNALRPMHIATIAAGKTFMGDVKKGTAGAVSAAVCRGCGYAELHVDDPGSIPVDGELVREVTGPASPRR